MKRILPMMVITTVLMQCASFYRPIDPPSIPFTGHSETEDLVFDYRYDVMTYRNNRKYAKRERKRHFNIFAAKIKNTTDRTLNFARDIELYTSRGTLYPIDATLAAKTVNQPIGWYLFYSIIVFTSEDCNGYDCHTTSVIPVGIGIAALNMVVGGAANGQMKKEFLQYDVHTQDIKPGETVHAIIAVPDVGYAPVFLRLKGSGS